MSQSMNEERPEDLLLALTARVVSAHAGHNAVPPNELPTLIKQVHATLAGLGTTPAAVKQPEPAVPIKRSVFPDYLVCLEDGKKLKMLKRHLQADHDMTVDQYRAKWGLPPNYPVVAPNYAEHRSSLAKKIGLGRKPAGISQELPVAAEVTERRGTQRGRGGKQAAE